MVKKGVVGKVTAPVRHAVSAAGETFGEVTNTAGNVAKRLVNGVKKIGSSLVSHTDEALRNVSNTRNNTKKRKRHLGKKKTRGRKN
jgi:hypothetical protein